MLRKGFVAHPFSQRGAAVVTPTALRNPGGALDASWAGRSSVAYQSDWVGGAILLTQAAANRARSDVTYDAARGLYLPGWRLEPERQNICIRSSEMNLTAPWLRAYLATVSANGSAGPTGANVMDGVVATAVSNYHGLAAINVTYSAATYVFSMFAKAGNKNCVQLDMNANSTVVFNVSTGAIVTTTPPSGTTARIVPCGGGICRVSVTKAQSATSTGNYSVYPVNDDGTSTFTGDAATVDAWLWGANVEIGAYPSSMIETGGAAATRTADAPIIWTIPTIYGAGSFCMPFKMATHAPAADVAICNLYVAGSEASDYLRLSYAQTTGHLKVESAAMGGNAGAVTVARNICDDGIHWLRVAWRKNMLCAWVDETAGAPDCLVDFPAFNRFSLKPSGGWAGQVEMRPYFSNIPIRPEQPQAVLAAA
jgi:hypothetical protein